MQMMPSAQQIGHFAQFGWIEFEQFLPSDTLSTIIAAASNVIAQRLHTTATKLSRYSAEEIYLQGNDLWRKAPILKSFFCSKQFCSTVAHLTKNHTLFLVCDQWIPASYTLDPLRMNEHMSYQNLICGCLLILDGEGAGNARFFQPERLPLTKQSQLIIAYGNLSTVYIYNPKDPFNAQLKQYGYSFGDRLRPDAHPMRKGILR